MSAPRCTVLGLGSRGDLQPLLALAVGLKAAGFAVRFAAPADYEPAVVAQGLEFFRLTGNAAGFFGGPAGIAMRDRVRDAREFQRFFTDYLGTFLDKLLRSCWEACQGSEALFCWSWTRAGPSLAEKLGVPLFVVSATPVLHLPTTGFANPFQGRSDLKLGPIYNRLSWARALPFTRIGQSQVDRWRQETLGLAPLPWRTELQALRRLPHLFGYSPSVLPKPWDWAPWVHVTGFWFLDQVDSYVPPPELAAFLEAGEPPVAVGFSSQVSNEARRISAAMVEALRLSGRRGILISGFGGLRGIELPDTIFRIDSVPYDWLLPRVAAMVHQGGAGSTGAVLRAGVPSFAVPFGYEQALWGRRIAELGAGPPPLQPAALSAATLAAAIERVAGTARFRSGAAEVAAAIGAEKGVATAVDLIERTLSSSRGRISIPVLRVAVGDRT
jgi:UDP:flavonoid glycosyltransferase YjiC (YdhE family)